MRKGMTVWLFSTLTFIALLHLIDAITAILFNKPTQLPQLYPLIGKQLQQIPTNIYLLASTASTITFWAITCLIAFDNPIEAFLNKIIADAQQQNTLEAQILESKSELFDLMYETIESDSETLAQVRDLMRNIRAEVKDIQPIKEAMEKTRAELSNLKKEIRTLEEQFLFTLACPSCGMLLRQDFKLCPYCGEGISLQEKMIIVKEYKQR
ncbi:MAG: hypothetical protein NWF09_06100 [Candidatus Bathyarchaeota archaeon]|nr:hypothetical protein [Candidatus Bathyarchaeota archaeon]